MEAISSLIVKIRSETDTLTKMHGSRAPLDRIVAKAVFQMVQAIALIAKLFRPEIFLDRGETIFDGTGLLAAVGVAVLHRLVIGGIVLSQRLDRGQTGINLTQAGLDRGDPIVLLRRQLPLFAELGPKGPSLRLERFPLGAKGGGLISGGHRVAICATNFKRLDLSSRRRTKYLRDSVPDHGTSKKQGRTFWP